MTKQKIIRDGINFFKNTKKKPKMYSTFLHPDKSTIEEIKKSSKNLMEQVKKNQQAFNGVDEWKEIKLGDLNSIVFVQSLANGVKSLVPYNKGELNVQNVIQLEQDIQNNPDMFPPGTSNYFALPSTFAEGSVSEGKKNYHETVQVPPSYDMKTGKIKYSLREYLAIFRLEPWMKELTVVSSRAITNEYINTELNDGTIMNIYVGEGEGQQIFIPKLYIPLFHATCTDIIHQSKSDFDHQKIVCDSSGNIDVVSKNQKAHDIYICDSITGEVKKADSATIIADEHGESSRVEYK